VAKGGGEKGRREGGCGSCREGERGFGERGRGVGGGCGGCGRGTDGGRISIEGL